MTGTGYLSASTCRDKGRGKKGSFERSLATTVGVEEKKSIHPAGGCRCHFVLIPWLSMEKKKKPVVTIKKYIYRLCSSSSPWLEKRHENGNKIPYTEISQHNVES